jgi:hypothetical protein
MKKFIIIILSLLFAFVVSELILNKIVGYPKRTAYIRYVFLPQVSKFEYMKFKEPHSKFWSVEAGNKVFEYNNLCVTGKDVNLTDKSRIIYVLGDSFVEAASVPPESTAVSVFQDQLDKYDSNLKALNVGYPNSDPYTLYFRAAFFEKNYKPEYVCLLVTHLDLLDMDFQRHSDILDFHFPENFGAVIPESKTDRFLDFFRKRSAVFSLFSASLSVSGEKKDKDITSISSVYKNDLLNSMRKFKDCLLKFKEKYGEKFWVLSLEVNDEKNKTISDACESIGVNYANKKLLTPEYLWGKETHLNIKGNKVFGEFLYETFIQFYKK